MPLIPELAHKTFSGKISVIFRCGGSQALSAASPLAGAKGTEPAMEDSEADSLAHSQRYPGAVSLSEQRSIGMCRRIRAGKGRIMIITKSATWGEGAHHSRFQIGWKFYIIWNSLQLHPKERKPCLTLRPEWQCVTGYI